MQTLTDWVPAIPTFLLAGVAIFVPGFVWGLAFRLRGRTLLIVAPLLSAFLIGTSAVVAGLLGFWWSWVFLLAYTLALSAVTWPVVWLLGGRKSNDSKAARGVWLYWEIAAGTVITAVISGWSMVRALGSPGMPVHTWDGTFHMSAARLVFATGNGSTFNLGRLASPDGGQWAFYPAGWHDLVALTMESSGDAALSSNITALFVMGILWPVGAALFVNALFPTLRFAPFAGALLASATTAFPERVASYGTLWPVLYAYALIPFALALAVVFFREKYFKPNWKLFTVLALGLIGIGLIHPQGVLAFLVLGLWLLVAQLFKVIKSPDSASTSGKVLVYVAPLVLVLGVVGLRFTPAGQTTTGWGDRVAVGILPDEIRGAIFDSQLSAQGYGNIGGFWSFAILLIAGAIALLVMRSQRWLIFSWASATYLYLTAATLVLPGYFLVGFWYSDPVRLGAMIPLVAVPIMAVGLAWPVNLILNRISMGGVPRAWVAGLTYILIFALLYGTTGGLGRHAGSLQLWINYTDKGESGLNGLVSEEELEMIGRVSEELPEGSVIIGSPFTGASLVFAVTGVDSVFKVYVAPPSGDLAYVAANFNNLEDDPRVCEILNDRGIHYFYHDTVLYQLEGQSSWYSALEHPGAVLDDLEVVDSGGTATLYRLSVCD